MSLAAFSHNTIYGLACLRVPYFFEILIIDGRIIFVKYPGPLPFLFSLLLKYFGAGMKLEKEYINSK